MRARGDRRRQAGPTGQRKGERERTRGRSQAGSACQGGLARGRARAGPAGLFWADMSFFYFQRISNAFSILFSLGFSIQIQTNFQIQTKSNMCINSKSILGSA
jgi:hypothetical protein